MICGGFTGTDREPDDEDRAILLSVKSDVEKRLSQQLSVFEAIAFQTQVVAGKNYIFKVRISEDSFIHVKVCKPLPHTNQPPFVLSLLQGQTLQSPIEPF